MGYQGDSLAQRYDASPSPSSRPVHRYCLHRQAYRWARSPFWRLVLVRQLEGGGVDDSARGRRNETAYNDASERDTCHRRSKLCRWRCLWDPARLGASWRDHVRGRHDRPDSRCLQHSRRTRRVGHRRDRVPSLFIRAIVERRAVTSRRPDSRDHGTICGPFLVRRDADGGTRRRDRLGGRPGGSCRASIGFRGRLHWRHDRAEHRSARRTVLATAGMAAGRPRVLGLP